jgi:hypothetical protein
MKNLVIITALFFCKGLHAQGYEMERLILDIQKLAQMKKILSDLYQGYEILNSGYNNIKQVAVGNFNLHKTFLDGLLGVSPAVSNYPHVTDIFQNQLTILSEYKSALSLFKKDPHFNQAEIGYLGQVYQNLLNGSIGNTVRLANIITAGVFRMSDWERLRAIDGIYQDTMDKLQFLRVFNTGTRILALQRASALHDNQTIINLYGLGNK